MPPLPENLRALQGPIAGGILLFVLGAVGIVWLSIAAVESAAALLGPVWGPATIGAALLAPAALAVLLSWAKARQRQAAPPTADGAAALKAIAAASHKMIANAPLGALALATLAGIMATRYPAGLTLLAEVFTTNEQT